MPTSDVGYKDVALLHQEGIWQEGIWQRPRGEWPLGPITRLCQGIGRMCTRSAPRLGVRSRRTTRRCGH